MSHRNPRDQADERTPGGLFSRFRSITFPAFYNFLTRCSPFSRRRLISANGTYRHTARSLESETLGIAAATGGWRALSGGVQPPDEDRRTPLAFWKAAKGLEESVAPTAPMLLNSELELIIKLASSLARRLYLARKGLTRPCDASALHVTHIVPARSRSNTLDSHTCARKKETSETMRACRGKCECEAARGKCYRVAEKRRDCPLDSFSLSSILYSILLKKRIPWIHCSVLLLKEKER